MVRTLSDQVEARQFFGLRLDRQANQGAQLPVSAKLNRPRSVTPVCARGRRFGTVAGVVVKPE
jgi:hypothetical protein